MTNQTIIEINEPLLKKLTTYGRITIDRDIIKTYGIKLGDKLDLTLNKVYKNNGNKN